MRRLLLALLLIAVPAGAAERLPAGTVRLPLKDYLTLVKNAEDAAHLRARPTPRPQERVAAVASEDTSITISGDGARFASTFEVVLQGLPTTPVTLSLTGLADAVTVSPAGSAAVRLEAGGLSLVAPEPGRYTVEVAGVAALTPGRTARTLALAPVVAPVARTRVEMPTDLQWKCPGAVVAHEDTADGRRSVELALPQGRELTLAVFSEATEDESEKLMGSVTAVTALRLEATGAARYDILAFKVARGRVPVHRVEVPPGLSVERAATDEGDVPPVLSDGHIVIQRETSLDGSGYVVLTTRLKEDPQELPLMTPGLPVSSRYLALTAGAPAEVSPLPEERWKKVDLQDLPEELSEDLSALDVIAVWRLAGDGTDGLGLAVHRLPEAPRQPSVAASRETTTLLTVDGTLLHRDTLVLEHPSTALELSLPAGATLWSAEVNGLTVRPVEEDGRFLLPLPFAAEAGAVVKVVVVQRHAVPPGRSQLEIALPAVGVPVLQHRWSVLLPETSRYRLAGSDLQPAAWTPPAASQAGRGKPSSGRIVAGGRSGLQGTVVDDGGQPLPGVTVVLKSPSLQGEKSAMTDAAGRYRFVLLPPGTYQARLALPGYQRVEQENIKIGFNRTLTFDVTLRSAFTEEIVVSGEAPLVNTTSTDLGMNLPTAPPAGRAPRRSRTYGSTGAENAYVVKGAAQGGFRDEATALRQGVASGVKPVPVKIPDRGKKLTLAGALPPATVHLTLEVKSPRK